MRLWEAHCVKEPYDVCLVLVCLGLNSVPSPFFFWHVRAIILTLDGEDAIKKDSGKQIQQPKIGGGMRATMIYSPLMSFSRLVLRLTQCVASLKRFNWLLMGVWRLPWNWWDVLRTFQMKRLFLSRGKFLLLRLGLNLKGILNENSFLLRQSFPGVILFSNVVPFSVPVFLGKIDPNWILIVWGI